MVKTKVRTFKAHAKSEQNPLQPPTKLWKKTKARKRHGGMQCGLMTIINITNLQTHCIGFFQIQSFSNDITAIKSILITHILYDPLLRNWSIVFSIKVW